MKTINKFTPSVFQKLGYDDVRDFIQALHNFLYNSSFDDFDKVERWTLLDAINAFIDYKENGED